jgi:uncharacterized membrane protein
VAAHVENYVSQIVPARAGLARALYAWLVATGCALAFIALIFAAPIFEARGHVGAAWTLYHAFAPLCHQIAERSFYVAGHPLAVCARCAGIYVGFALSLVLYPLVRDVRRTDAPPRAWLVAVALPTTVDFLINFTGLWHNTHWSRALTGALLGAGAVFFVVPGLVDLARTTGRGARSRDAKVFVETDASVVVARARDARGALAPDSTARLVNP